MTVAGEEIVYKLTLDASGAATQLTAFDERAEHANSRAHALGETLDKVGGKAGKDAANGLRTASFAMGSLGGEAGNVLNVLGDLADVVTGGPLVAGLVLLGAGAAAVWGEYEKVEKRADDAREALHRFVADIEREHLATIDKLKTGVKDLAEELLNFGKDAAQVKLDALVEQRATMDEDIAGLERRLQKASSDADIEAGKMKPDAGYLQSLQGAVAIGSAKLADLKQEAEVTGRAIDSTTRLVLTLDARAQEAKDKALSSAAAKAAYDAATDAILAGPDVGENAVGLGIADPEAAARQKAAAREKGLDMIALAEDKARDLREAKEAAAYARDQRLQDDADSVRIKRAQENAAKLAAIGDQFAQQASALAESVAGAASSSLFSYFDAVAAGEKDAGQKVVASFMKQIGQQLVGIGIRSEFEGASKLFDPITAPIGLAQIAFGIGAIGAGVGLGAAGAFTAPQKGSAAPAPDRGVNTGRGSGGRGTGGGGGLTIVNNYGAAGPRAEDAARENVELWRIANRRRFS